MREYSSLTMGNQPGASRLQRRRIPIQAQESPIWRGGRQYPGRVSAPSHRRVYVTATRPNSQAIEHRLEKNRDMDTPHPILSRTTFTGTVVR